MWNMERWDLLPDELLLIIFKYMEDHDLVSASRTCKQWRRVYHDPCLWRSRTFEFRGYCKSHSDRLKTLTKYVDSMGCYMQHIRIICPSPNLLTAYNVAKCVEAVLGGLSCLQSGTITIQSFQMCQLHFDETWSGFKSSKSILVDSVSKFMESQTNIKSFSMYYAFMTPPFAYRIMNSFSRSKSIKTIESLNILHYYSLEVSTRLIGSQLRTICRKCCKLKEITLNYSYLSSAQIVDLCEYLDATLEKLVIYVTILDYSRGWNVINSDSWRLACEACPGLKVSFHLEGWPRDATSFLVPCMPLVELSSKGSQCRYSAFTYGEKTSILLDHLSKCFPDSIQSATFESQSHIFTPPQKDAVIHFLITCKNVRALTFSKQLMIPELISDIKTELTKKRIKDLDAIKIV